MPLSKKIATVPQTFSRYDAHYAKARARRPAFAPFETSTHLVDALNASSALPQTDRYALAQALVAQFQEEPQLPLWGAMLLVAFAPMLLRTRRRLGNRGDEDLDQEVMIAFLAAAGDIAADVYATVALQRATWKAVLRRRRAMNEETVPFDEEIHTPTSPDGITMAELRAEAAWAARRAQRAEALFGRAPAEVKPLPSDVSRTRGRSSAA